MVDVVIIGGGPAGVSAATILQRKGFNTCIIDSQLFPRKKLCAGVLTAKSIKLLQSIYKGLDLESLSIKHIHKITLLFNRTTIGEYSITNAYSVIDRTEFDNALFQYYKKIGGLAYEGQRDYRIDYKKNMIILSDGTEIPYRILIGADGINSKIRSYVSHTWRASVLCFEEFIPNASQEDTIKINFGGILGGYSWRIPGKDKIGVGLGEFYIRGMKRKLRKYRKFFQSQGVNDLQRINGAFVSFGNFVRKPIKNNVLLVGDAAGLIDAMTGEGIFFAIESGRQAALTITDYLEKGIPLTAYSNRLQKIHRKMKEQSIYNKLLYVPVLQLISLRYIMKNPQFAQSVFEDAVSTYHSGYTKEIRKNSKKK